VIAIGFASEKVKVDSGLKSAAKEGCVKTKKDMLFILSDLLR
jgi:hypothetical protein